MTKLTEMDLDMLERLADLDTERALADRPEYADEFSLTCAYDNGEGTTGEVIIKVSGYGLDIGLGVAALAEVGRDDHYLDQILRAAGFGDEDGFEDDE